MVTNNAINTATGASGTLLVGQGVGSSPTFGTSATGDFTFTSTTAGATRTFTVSNTDNTNAASTALHQITTGGASAGDPFTTYTVTGATSWSTGVDNSASDAYVIAASTALGTTNVVSMATGGAVSCVLGNFDVTKSSSGADVSITASNTSNTATSSATAYLTVAGSTAADARVQYAVSGTTTWTEGIDNSDSDAYVLSASNALGSTNVMRASTAGEINYPLQPAFLAYLGTTDSNVTGDGTVYTLGSGNALTEVFDQNSDFVTTGTFTAPVTGKYYLGAATVVSGTTSATDSSETGLITSNRTFVSNKTNPFSYRSAAGGETGWGLTVLADMDAADTFTVTITISRGTKVVDIVGSANPLNSIWGSLNC